MSDIEKYAFNRLLRVTSDQSIRDNDTITNFSVNLSRMTETNQIIRVVAKSVSFINNAYNVHTSGELKNNTFEYEVKTLGSFTHDIAMSGFYTTTQLIDILQPVIESDMKTVDPAATLSLTLDAITNKIKVDITGTAELILNANNSLNLVLGNTTTSGDITSASPYYFDKMADLQGLTKVYLHSTSIAEQHLVDGDVESHDVLAEIPVLNKFGTLTNYESTDDELDSITYRSERNIDFINISLRNAKNQIIPLNGGVLTVVLKLYYI